METSFIEVAGQAFFTEHAQQFPVSVQLEVMLPISDAEDIHERFTAWDERFAGAIAAVRSQFITIEDGGTKFDIKLDTLAQSIPQRYKRLTRRYRFLAPSAELRDRLVELVSGLPSSKQETVDVMVPQPIFEASTEAVQHALREAVEDAHAKAAVIALASGGRVGKITSARQMPQRVRASGALGDEDWWGDNNSLHIGGARDIDADDPTRKVCVRFLVRFELIHDEPQRKTF